MVVREGEEEAAAAGAEQRSEQLRRLAAAALLINSTLSLDELLQAITEQARETIGAGQAVTRLTGGIDAPADGSGFDALVCRENRSLRLTATEAPPRGWLAAPLVGRDGRNLGLVQLSDKHVGEFDAEDEAILVQLAQMASAALENARLYSEVEAERNRLAELARMAATVARAESLDDVFEAGLDTIQRALGVERSAILLLDQDGNLHLRAWRGLSEQYRATVGARPPLLPFGSDPTPIVIPDVLAEPRLAPTHEALQAEGIHAMTLVPLVHAGQRLGALVYDGVLVEEELGFVQTVASHVAAMSERTRAEAELRASRTELEVIFSGVADGITAQDPHGRIVYANDAASRLLGFDTAAELLAADIAALVADYEVLDEYRRPLPFDEFPGRIALRERRTAERTMCYRRRGRTEERWSIVRATPVLDDAGTALFAINIFHDVTERRHSEERLRFLGEAGAVLSSTLDYELTLSELGRLVVPQFADYCLVDMLDDDGELRQVVHVHVDPDRDAVLAELRLRYPVMGNTGHPAKRVLDSGVSLLIEESTEAELRAAALDERHFELYRRLDPTSYIVVPLRARGRTMGVISFGTGESGRRYDEEDVAFAEQLAARAALAVDNALLFREAEQAAAAANESVASLALLADASEALAQHLDARETLASVARLALPVLADGCNVYLAEGDALVRVATAHVEPERVALYDALPPSYPLATDSPTVLVEVYRSGRPRHFADLEEELLAAAEAAGIERETWALLGTESILMLPLQARGRPLGVITFSSLRAHRFDEADVALATELARRAAVAVDNSLLFEAERASRRRLGFLAEASTLLGSSLDVDQTLASLARLVVPGLADWCSITLTEEDGSLRSVAIAHADPDKLARAQEFNRRFPSRREDETGVAQVIRTGEPSVVRELTDELLEGALAERPDQLAMAREIGLRSVLIVPLAARGRVIGALTFIQSDDSGRRFDDADLELAEELARRAAVAVDNASLFRELNVQRGELEQRARAAQALEFVGDGVALVDVDGAIRLWNPAAARMTGLREAEVAGGLLDVALPGWRLVADRIPVVQASDELAPTRAETVPLEIGGVERWLSVSGVAFPEGTVYAFRDLTEERAVERLKSDFVSTVSHELRTPLAAIYGAAVTLRRVDVELSPEQQDGMLSVVASESERLARIVNDILLASRLDSGLLEVAVGAADAAALARGVIEVAKTHVPASIKLELDAPDGLPAVAADEDRVRQVLGNLVENAIKYSPDGGRVRVKVERAGARHVRFSVADEGLGIPASEHGRIFEKFYRLDPNLTRGVGGTGLGLYICREIVRRMDGRIWVASTVGRGSTFSVELPVAAI